MSQNIKGLVDKLQTSGSEVDAAFCDAAVLGHGYLRVTMSGVKRIDPRSIVENHGKVRADQASVAFEYIEALRHHHPESFKVVTCNQCGMKYEAVVKESICPGCVTINILEGDDES